MPMKPAPPDRVPPIRKPMAIRMRLERDREHDRQHHRDPRDDRVLAAKVRLSALLHGGRDLLHLGVSGRESKQPA
jgi:hypothetical protein